MDLPLLLSLQQQCVDQMNDCGIGGDDADEASTVRDLLVGSPQRVGARVLVLILRPQALTSSAINRQEAPVWANF